MAEDGLLVVFEGTNGSGKSTLMRKVAKRLDGEGKNVVETREPGGFGKTGDVIRELLLSDKYSMDIKTELLLFMADRGHHVRNTILPSLEKGAVVMSDRYWESTLVFQVMQMVKDEVIGKEELELFLKFNDTFVMEGCYPDITFIINSKENLNGEDGRDRIEDNSRRDVIYESYKLLEDMSFIKYRTVWLDTTDNNWDEYEEKVYKILKNYEKS